MATSGSYGAYNVNDPTKQKTNALPGQTEQLQTSNTADPNATVKLSNAAMSGKAADLAMGPNYNQDLYNATNQSATDFVKNPMGDFDPAKYKQQRMEKADLDWANTFENTRQLYGNASGSGLLQKNMLQNALQHDVDMNALESDIDNDSYEKRLDALTRSLTSGNQTNQTNANLIGQGIQNLNVVKGMQQADKSMELADKQMENMDVSNLITMMNNGQIDNNAALEIIGSKLGLSGLTAPDVKEKALQAIRDDFETQQAQFAMSHPELVDQATGKLNQQGLSAFNAQYNRNLFDEDVVGKVKTGDYSVNDFIGGADPASPNHDAYMELQKTAQPITLSNQPGWDGKKHTFPLSVPAENQPFTYNGKVYISKSGIKTLDRGGGKKNTEYFTAVDANTGEEFRILADDLSTIANR